MAAAVDKLARWYLRRQPPDRPVDVIGRPAVVRCPRRQLATAASGPAAAGLAGMGVPADVAARADALAVLAGVGELAEVARSTGRQLGTALDAHRVVEAELSLPWLTEALRGWPAPDRWQRWELHSLADDIAYIRVAAAISTRAFPERRGASRSPVAGVQAGRCRSSGLAPWPAQALVATQPPSGDGGRPGTRRLGGRAALRSVGEREDAGRLGIERNP